jgi:tetratricopeptide (TPR) repeat protein
MAFGFGFNKQKVLSNAEKFVQQGKLQNAVAEYEKILKSDPKDLTVLNTVGDLYARDGQGEKAVECFKSVGDAYATQGFTVKAIAMYKKLTKLKPSMEGVLRLAELYTTQGLFNDARAQYLQVAEEFLKSGELEQAARIFQKMLEMDPENVAIRMRLGDIYLKLGRKKEAWQIFSNAAETMRARGSLSGAEEVLQRMLAVDPGNSYALLLRGRNALEAGDPKAAIKNLEKVADLDSSPDGLRVLFQAYLQAGQLGDAGAVAGKLFTVHNDAEAVFGYADALMSAGQYAETLKLYEQYADRLLALNSAKVVGNLHATIGHLRENSAALEALLELLTKAGDQTHLAEIYELLAHGYVQSKKLEKARDYYLKLTQMEPENQMHARNYQQVLGMLGATAEMRQLITVEEGISLVDELEATSPTVEQQYPDNVALAVRAALTDAELFVSYNMPEKALGPLISALPRAPRDLRLNQRLAALHTRTGRFADAAACCHTLESVYHDAGFPEEASRYGELAEKYEDRAAAVAKSPVNDTPNPAPAQDAWAGNAPEVVANAASSPAEFTIQPSAFEQPADSSADWEDSFSLDESSDETAPSPGPAVYAQPLTSSEAVQETVEEVRFYMAHSMLEQAQAAMEKLEHLAPASPQVAALRSELEAAAGATGPQQQVDAADETPSGESLQAHFDVNPEGHQSAPGIETGGPASSELSIPVVHVSESEPVSNEEPVEVASTEGPPDTLTSLVADLESSLGEGFEEAPPAETPGDAPANPQAAPNKAFPEVAAGASVRAAQTPIMSPSVAGSAGGSAAAAAPAFTYQPTPVRRLSESPAEGTANIDLSDIFGDIKDELEQGTNAHDDDPETHYNLGVAFREMGLLDEAIGELQKVCQAVEQGHPFPQLMQTYTWLAQCFLDKSVPEAAVRWYECALRLPNLDPEARMALHYELGSACELAHNRPAALEHFLQVYGSNIDYRDVAERIQGLKS